MAFSKGGISDGRPPRRWSYSSTGETVATIIADDYFNEFWGGLEPDDTIKVTGSDSTVVVTVTSNADGAVTLSQATATDGTVTVANGDSGEDFQASITTVYTLPALSIGRVFKFTNVALDGVAQISVSPAAADGVMYATSATDDKDLINTLATSRKGDYVVIGNTTDGIAFWQVLDIKGIWAKEA